MILPLNTGTHQLSDNPTISSILPNSNTPQVGNIMGKPCTNETMEKNRSTTYGNETIHEMWNL